MKEVVLGIDIGGTYTKFGIVSREGELFLEKSVDSGLHTEVKDYIYFLKKNVYESVDINKYKITGIGIGAPNGNYYTGTIEQAPNLTWKGEIKLAELFKEIFELPVVLTNDANAAALGEMIYGGAKNMKDFIMITLGTGLGSGLVVNGKMVYGHDGFAGELGHVTVDINGRQCACGKKGCLETYASATGIERTAFELMATEIDESELRKYSFDELDAKMISEAALKGDTLALKAFDYTGKLLGLKLADAVAHTSPEAIFLFGGLAAAKDLIFLPTIKYFEQFLLPIYRNKIQILPSALQDKNIAVLGAAALYLSEELSQNL
jgi:glucokinase